MPTIDQEAFRRIALGLQGAVEGAHMGHPDFRVNGRIFASLHQDGERGMVQLPTETQAAFISDHPEVFSPASGAWGRGGSTMVRLAAVDETVLGEALTLAWQEAVRRGPAKPRPVRASARSRGR